MRNKKPVQEGSQVVAGQAGPLACLHLLLISKRTKNLLETVLGGCTFPAKLMACPQPGLHVWAAEGWHGLHRVSPWPLNVKEEQNQSHSSQFFSLQFGLALVVVSALVPIFAIANSSRDRAKSGQGILSQLYWDKPGLFAAYVDVKMVFSEARVACQQSSFLRSACRG